MQNNAYVFFIVTVDKILLCLFRPRLHFVHDVTLFCRSFNDAMLLCFLSHCNDMTSWLSSSAENVSCNVAPFFYHQCGDTTSCIRHFVSDRWLSLISKGRHARNVVSLRILYKFYFNPCSLFKIRFYWNVR
jgi:hypothetical protein